MSRLRLPPVTAFGPEHLQLVEDLIERWANAGATADSYAAVSTADLTLSTTATLVAGCTVTVAEAGTYLVTGTFDFYMSAAGGSAGVGQLYVDTVGQSTSAILVDAAVRATVSQTWIVAVLAGKVVELRASKAVAAGTSQALHPHTTLQIIRIGA
jgi:hypothetical protein